VLVIPDGCVDVIWRTDGHLLIAGPDRGPVEHEQPAGAGYLGVRLRPGTAGATLGLDLSAIVDQLVDATDLLGADGRRLGERIHRAQGADEQLCALVRGVAERLEHQPVDGDVAAVAADLSTGAAGVSDAVRATGLSERHLRRRFQAQVGYGPKTFERIMRLQRFISTARARSRELAASAAEVGYADQAHLSRDCRDLTGRTPTTLLQTLS
jgi:AraC-like DNA-binding protein